MSTATIILLIICCIVAIISAIWFNCCIRNNIQQRINRTMGSSRNSDITIADNYLFSRNNREIFEKNADITVPPIIPIVRGEKVDFESKGVVVIVAE
jgi:hypothetical protein